LRRGPMSSGIGWERLDRDVLRDYHPGHGRVSAYACIYL
jgi:hypothetical protein